MRTHTEMNRIPFVLLLILCLLPLVVSTGFLPLQEPSISVIANEKGAPASITMRELKKVLQGEKQRWPDGTPITIAFMKTSTPVGSATARKLLNMTGDQLNKMWLALVFQGKAKAPSFFNSAQELETYVNSTPGAIGILDGNIPLKARVLPVDDKKSF